MADATSDSGDQLTEQTHKEPFGKRPETSPHILHQQTLRRPLWTYFHLSLFSTLPSPQDALDILTAKTYLSAALQRFLGLSGLAVPLDILKVEEHGVWIRIPREDAAMVQEALGSWSSTGVDGGVKWVIRGRDDWLGRLVSGEGSDLFGAAFEQALAKK